MTGESAIDQVRRGAEEATYTAVGLGLLAIQRAAARRRALERRSPELARVLGAVTPRVSGIVASALSTAEQVAGEVAKGVGALLAPVVDAAPLRKDVPASPREPRRG